MWVTNRPPRRGTFGWRHHGHMGTAARRDFTFPRYPSREERLLRVRAGPSSVIHQSGGSPWKLTSMTNSPGSARRPGSGLETFSSRQESRVTRRWPEGYTLLAAP